MSQGNDTFFFHFSRPQRSSVKSDQVNVALPRTAVLDHRVQRLQAQRQLVAPHRIRGAVRPIRLVYQPELRTLSRLSDVRVVRLHPRTDFALRCLRRNRPIRKRAPRVLVTGRQIEPRGLEVAEPFHHQQKVERRPLDELAVQVRRTLVDAARGGPPSFC